MSDVLDSADVDLLLRRTQQRAGRLESVLAAATDADMREPSALPGWSRGHVATHLADVARAYARQATYAARGKLIDQYDGGREGRAASIEAGSGRSIVKLRASVAEGITAMENAWPLTADIAAWQQPVRHRDGTVFTVLQSWWREVVLHTDDLMLPGASRDWESDFFVHLTQFLAPRAPEDVVLTLTPNDDAPPRTIGSGTAVQVTGSTAALTAWLAGRDPREAVRSDSGELPELGPWP